MKGKTDHPIKGPSIYEARVCGVFAPQGTGAPTIVYPTKHPRFSVVRTSQGLWTVTLLDPFYEWAVISLRLGLAAAATRDLELQTFNMASKTFGVANIDAANTAQDIAANALNTIAFEISGMVSGA